MIDDTPNGGEAGDWVAALLYDEWLETIVPTLLALLDCGALIEEEATSCDKSGIATYRPRS